MPAYDDIHFGLRVSHGHARFQSGEWGNRDETRRALTLWDEVHAIELIQESR
jgi:hypothetical protein